MNPRTATQAYFARKIADLFPGLKYIFFLIFWTGDALVLGRTKPDTILLGLGHPVLILETFNRGCAVLVA